LIVMSESKASRPRRRAPVPTREGPWRRFVRLEQRARAWLVYRADQALGWPPLAQVLLLGVLGAAITLGFAWIELHIHPRDAIVPNESEALWWTATHFLDGGTMASDPPYRRGIALATTLAGILLLALLTAALTSKMGERIADVRSGLNPVVERGHFLVLGFDPNVPLIAREIARSHQRATLVVLSNDDKDRIEAVLRVAHRVPGSRLKIVVRTGDPRTENALLRVAAQHARAALIVPPTALDDDASVEWSLGSLLALRRVVGQAWSGRAFVLARHEEAVDLLALAAEPDVAGPGALAADVIASDAVIAAILAQSTREDGIYALLRHMMAFDGCELYLEKVAGPLVGKTFEYAHAVMDHGIVVGVRRADGTVLLSPPVGQVTLRDDDRLVVLAASAAAPRLGGALPPAPELPPDSLVPVVKQHVAVVGWGATVPHLSRELARILPQGSSVHLVPGDALSHARSLVAQLGEIERRVEWIVHERPGAELAHSGHPTICGADSVVILGHLSDDEANGDASALAMLLRMRHGLRKVGRPDRVRIVTDVRDPRSAGHVAPRPGDSIVSSDIVAMLLAQELLDPETGPIYRDLLSPGGAVLALKPRAEYLPPGEATFAQLLAAARARGEIALGFHPDPRLDPRADDMERLEEGDPIVAEVPWLNPPREAAVPEDDDVRIAVLTHAAPRRDGRARSAR
jgi:hypothetical protein